jgi:predicted dehydrogenase
VSFLASSVAYTTRSSIVIAVHCRSGSVTVQIDSGETDPRGRLTVMRRGEDAPHDEALAAPRAAHAGPADAAYDAIAQELIDAIDEGRDASPGFADGVRVQATIDAALASAASGRWTDIVTGNGKGR